MVSNRYSQTNVGAETALVAYIGTKELDPTGRTTKARFDNFNVTTAFSGWGIPI